MSILICINFWLQIGWNFEYKASCNNWNDIKLPLQTSSVLWVVRILKLFLFDGLAKSTTTIHSSKNDIPKKILDFWIGNFDSETHLNVAVEYSSIILELQHQDLRHLHVVLWYSLRVSLSVTLRVTLKIVFQSHLE